MWRELINDVVAQTPDTTKIRYASGANEEELLALETSLGVALPEDLAALLRESNGVLDEYGLHIIWSTEEIERYNHEMRSLSVYTEFYMPFVNMLFFADAGNGDCFAFPIIQGKVEETSVFAWNHEDDSRVVVAYSLRSYLERWLSGELHI